MYVWTCGWDVDGGVQGMNDVLYPAQERTRRDAGGDVTSCQVDVADTDHCGFFFTRLGSLITRRRAADACSLSLLPLQVARTTEALLNDQRASAGRNRLASRSDLQADATRQAEAMASRGSIYHQQMVPLLSKWDARWVSENVANNFISAGAPGLVKLWMESTGHRINLLDERATHTGCGVVQRDGWNWSSCVYAEVN